MNMMKCNSSEDANSLSVRLSEFSGAQKFIVMFRGAWRLSFASLIPFVPLYSTYVWNILVSSSHLYGTWDSVVSIATRYWLDIPGFEPRRDFPDRFSSARRPTQPSVQWLPVLFPGDKATAGHLPASSALMECEYNYIYSLCACLASNGSSSCLDVASGLILASSLTSILRVFLIRLEAVTFRNFYWLN